MPLQVKIHEASRPKKRSINQSFGELDFVGDAAERPLNGPTCPAASAVIPSFETPFDNQVLGLYEMLIKTGQLPNNTLITILKNERSNQAET
jgi:hypothetical protein